MAKSLETLHPYGRQRSSQLWISSVHAAVAIWKLTQKMNISLLKNKINKKQHTMCVKGVMRIASKDKHLDYPSIPLTQGATLEYKP